jgi:lambda repressor-like predicted transcriptional regulator
MRKTLKNAEEVTLKQRKAIAALLATQTVREAAKHAGVAEKTLYQWLAQPAFKRALQDAQTALLDEVLRRLSAGAGLAVDTLRQLTQSGEHESTRLRAAIAWMELVVKYKDVLDFEARLEALESAVFGRQKNEIKNQET